MINTLEPDKAYEYFKAKMSFTTGPVELNKWISGGEDIQIIDVREPVDFNKGHIPSAVNLPRSKWDTLEGLDLEKVNIVYCYSGVCHSAANAALEFSRRGYRVIELDGGFETWSSYNLPVDSSIPVGASVP